jgi:hypothetical protein
VTTTTWSSKCEVDSAADFNALFVGIYNALVGTNGWVQTADTTQINLSTNSSFPSTTNQSIGWQMWHMNDSLEASYPVFMKIEFGSGSGATYPAIWITLGTGSDGSGNVTGIFMARTQIVVNGAGSSSASNFVCVKPNCLLIRLGQGSTTYQLAFVVERNHSSAGVDTTDGCLVLWQSGSSSIGSWYVPFAGGGPTSYAKWSCNPAPSGSGSLSPNINAYPVRAWNPGESVPFQMVAGFINGDLAVNSTFSITAWDGVARTYITDAGGVISISVNAATAYALWEHD